MEPHENAQVEEVNDNGPQTSQQLDWNYAKQTSVEDAQASDKWALQKSHCVDMDAVQDEKTVLEQLARLTEENRKPSSAVVEQTALMNQGHMQLTMNLWALQKKHDADMALVIEQKKVFEMKVAMLTEANEKLSLALAERISLMNQEKKDLRGQLTSKLLALQKKYGTDMASVQDQTKVLEKKVNLLTEANGKLSLALAEQSSLMNQEKKDLLEQLTSNLLALQKNHGTDIASLQEQKKVLESKAALLTEANKKRASPEHTSVMNEEEPETAHPSTSDISSKHHLGHGTREWTVKTEFDV
jgi:hypothetical protein